MLAITAGLIVWVHEETSGMFTFYCHIDVYRPVMDVHLSSTSANTGAIVD